MLPASRLREWLTRPLRLLRWRVSGWSANADQAFHDRIFEGASYDPCSDGYPGYVTIRRFADYAARNVDGVRTLVDLGCGPGEITCELARRFPNITFHGVDHSGVAVERARSLAHTLRLDNVSFHVGDFDFYASLGQVDLVVMFDAFHHVIDPEAFLSRLNTRCGKLFLVEPAGTWIGNWNRRGDLDWLPATILQIRDRLEEQLGAVPVRNPQHLAPETTADPRSVPTEHRYPLADLERLFRGYDLTLRGTIAGLEQYGPRPYDRSALRDAVGRLNYELVVKLDDLLFEQGMDLAAKHWTIFAQAGGSGTSRDVWSRQPRLQAQPAAGLLPAYSAEYGEYVGPKAVRCRARFVASIQIANTGWRAWDSREPHPTCASYHWLDMSGRTIVHDGVRTPFADAVGSGERCAMTMNIVAPDTAGTYRLVIDLVRDGITWFSEQGCSPRGVGILVSGDETG